MPVNWAAHRERTRWEHVRSRLLAHAPDSSNGQLIVSLRVADIRLAVAQGDRLEDALEELELLKGRVQRALKRLNEDLGHG